MGSVALHAAAAALTVTALAWRTAPAPAGAPPSVQMLFLPRLETAPEARAPEAPPSAAMPEGAVLGPMTEGVEPEDALATQVGSLPTSGAVAPAGLAPLPIPAPEVAELPADPTALFAPPAGRPQIASLSLPPPPAATQAAELPLPPPLPPAPPRKRVVAAPAAAMVQPAVSAPPVADATIPLLSGAPRFRRPPAPPIYPAPARDAGIEGTAMLRLRIAADGTLRDIRLHHSAGHRLLDEAAQAAARRWEIAPALRNGQPIEAWVEVPVRFRLDD